jgi:hypothetical protein
MKTKAYDLGTRRIFVKRLGISLGVAFGVGIQTTRAIASSWMTGSALDDCKTAAHAVIDAMVLSDTGGGSVSPSPAAKADKKTAFDKRTTDKSMTNCGDAIDDWWATTGIHADSAAGKAAILSKCCK